MYTALAIDHRQSFDKWLCGRLNGASRQSVKDWIIDSTADLADGLVLGEEPSPTEVLCSYQASELWWGAPDVSLEEQPVDAPLQSTFRQAKAVGFSGVKLGVGVSTPATWHLVVEYLAKCDLYATAAGIELIFEPYFGPSDSPDARASVISTVGEFSSVRFCKLDIRDSTFFTAYSAATHGNWLARSDGMSFHDFSGGLTEAISKGCSGFMAGSAIWGDVLRDAQVDGLEGQRNRLRNRLAQLVATVHP